MKGLQLIGMWGLLCLLMACGHPQGSTPDDTMTAQACLEAGEAELARDSVRQGETLLRRAIRLAEKSADWHTCYIAYQRLAKSLSWSNSEEALLLAKKAVEVYEAHPDDERNHIILLDFAGTYASQLAYNTDDDYTEALALTKRAHELAVKEKAEDLVCQTLTTLANIYWAMEDYPQALDEARKAEQLATPDLLQGTLQVLARCYLSCDSLEQAEATYRRMEPGDDIHAAYIVQSNLAKIATRRLASDEAEEAIDEAFEEVEALYFQALAQKDAYYQTTLQQEKENEHLAYTAALHRRTLVGIIAALAILLTATVLVLRYRLRLVRQQRAYEVAQHEQEKRHLQQEAERQQQQLHQSQEVVAFLQNFILQRSEVIRKLSESSSRHINLNPKEWADVERTLNAIDGDRFARLRTDHPDMKEEDIQLCILTRLQLSNRSIGNIYGLTVSAVQHRKLKLKKDIFGETNPDVTLEQVLTQSGIQIDKNNNL
ncbi:MAG: tetratricopeptide repeat protein [Bacteroidaceae bacterium]|nr:tetratricopeptide repeat protein [Bacteroidaceae bacterium]